MHDGTGSAFDHSGDDRAVQPDGRQQVGFQRGLPVFVGEVGRATVVLPGTADVVDRDVDGAESFQRLGGQCGDAVGSGDIGGDDVIGGGVFGHRPSRDQHPRAAGAQPVGDALADAAGSAGDQCRPAGEVIVVGHAASLPPAADTYFASMVPELVASCSLCSSASGMFSGCSISA